MKKAKYVKTEILRSERETRNYTYEDMAKKLGYKSKSTYMYIENGQTVPTVPVMLKIAQVFNKPVAYFFNLDVQESQTIPTGTDS